MRPPGLTWARLDVDYFQDDRVVALRRLHGPLAENVWTRLIAVTVRSDGPIRCPVALESATLAGALGFDRDEEEAVQAILSSAITLGLVIYRKTKRWGIYDLANREEKMPPLRDRPAYWREAKRRQRTRESRPDAGPPADVPPDCPADFRRTPAGQDADCPPDFRRHERTNRTDEESEGKGSSDIPLLVGRYLGRLAEFSPVPWEGISEVEVLDIGERYGLAPEETARILGDVWDWWRTAPKAKRDKKSAARFFGTWVRREVEQGREAAAARRTDPAPDPEAEGRHRAIEEYLRPDYGAWAPALWDLMLEQRPDSIPESALWQARTWAVEELRRRVSAATGIPPEDALVDEGLADVWRDLA